MPKVSVNILTKNRCELLQKALLSVQRQSFTDYEIVLVDDGSTDGTERIVQTFKQLNILTIRHPQSLGITTSRQEALQASRGEYVAVLDDDDEWIDVDKLVKQVKYLDEHHDVVLVGGGIGVETRNKKQETRMRPEADEQIRITMLLRNNFFTSTVVFRREAAIKAGGFVKDQDDFAEDYDLWLRLGKQGKMHNFMEVFTSYRQPSYNKERFKAFLRKQLRLIKRDRNDYPHYWLASLILMVRTGQFS